MDVGENTIELRSFKSRKNRASLYRSESGLLVKKSFTSRAAFEREREVYLLLRETSLAAPRLLGVGENVLWLSYIEGATLLEALEEQESRGEADFEIWCALARWLKNFFTATRMIMLDVNLNNFIYNPQSGILYGLDFEECAQGDLIECAAALTAFVKLYNPELSRVKMQAAAFLRESFLANDGDGAEFDALELKKIEELRRRRQAKRG
ncbi:MAG: hypothetical protein Q4B42_03495 [Oscillospiraceae bacterium]|nr:hypothetical protein [Oscillospiraceae bacterium]